ncbi:MAG: hypothetical protein CVT61_01910 [Actinobacteria bacterium HGW-Actinobacteria-11]|nr:MAG: hypothetical protein CVT61_01910 [Actinobacteria bacterium HGW-Actinobacteria-11]
MNKKIMAPRPTSKTILAASLSLALGIGGVALAAQSASASESTPPTPVQPATIQSSIDGYTVTLTKTATDIELYETINEVDIVTGWSPLQDIAADQAIADSSGIEVIEPSDPTGVAQMKVIGQAGTDVAAVSVTTATGFTIDASLVDGIWLAAWQSEFDSNSDSLDFTLTYTTTSGETRTVPSSAFEVQD